MAQLHKRVTNCAGLFSKAILQSGLFTGKWSIWPEPAKQAKRFAQKFGCTNETSRAMIDCMKDLDVRTLVDAHKEILVSFGKYRNT